MVSGCAGEKSTGRASDRESPPTVYDRLARKRKSVTIDGPEKNGQAGYGAAPAPKGTTKRISVSYSTRPGKRESDRGLRCRPFLWRSTIDSPKIEGSPPTKLADGARRKKKNSAPWLRRVDVRPPERTRQHLGSPHKKTDHTPSRKSLCIGVGRSGGRNFGAALVRRGKKRRRRLLVRPIFIAQRRAVSRAGRDRKVPLAVVSGDARGGEGRLLQARGKGGLNSLRARGGRGRGENHKRVGSKA